MLSAVVPFHSMAAVLRYGVEVRTAARPAADSDAPVYMTLVGEHGDSGKRVLGRSQSGNQFHTGKVCSGQH